MEKYLPIFIENKSNLYKKISDINTNQIKNILKPFFKTYNTECYDFYEDKWKLCKKECFRKLSKIINQ